MLLIILLSFFLTLPGSIAAIPTREAKGLRNIAFLRYAYEGQWAGSDLSYLGKTPVNLSDITAHDTGITTLVIRPCEVFESDPYHPSCHGHRFDDPYWKPLWPQIRHLQSQGVEVMPSFGGIGSSTFFLLRTEFNTYYPPLAAILTAFKFDGVDFDIKPASSPEGWVPKDLDLPLSLVGELRNDMGSQFLITFTAEPGDLAFDDSKGYSGINYIELDRATKNSARTGASNPVSWYNAQFFQTPSHGAFATEYKYVIARGEWDPSRMVFLACSSEAVGEGSASIETLTSTARAIGKAYGTWGGMGGYEYALAGSSDGLTRWARYKQIGQAL